MTYILEEQTGGLYRLRCSRLEVIGLMRYTVAIEIARHDAELCSGRSVLIVRKAGSKLFHPEREIPLRQVSA